MITRTRTLTLAACAAVVLLLTGCTGMSIKDFAGRTPELRLEDYFAGQTRAWGLFEDRFGTLRREFVVDITGTWDGQVLVLEEDFVYADGDTQRRVWRLEKTGPTTWRGTADDVLGVAEGEVAGNAFSWRYAMDLPVGDSTWRVTFDDWMFLQPDGTLLNRAYVRRWGILIGSVTIAFRPQPEGDDQRSMRRVSAKNAP